MLFSAFFKAITLVDASPGSARCGDGVHHKGSDDKGSDENLVIRRAGGSSHSQGSDEPFGVRTRFAASSSRGSKEHLGTLEGAMHLLALKVLMNLSEFEPASRLLLLAVLLPPDVLMNIS
jgi:hypothetical protein